MHTAYSLYVSLSQGEAYLIHSCCGVLFPHPITLSSFYFMSCECPQAFPQYPCDDSRCFARKEMHVPCMGIFIFGICQFSWQLLQPVFSTQEERFLCLPTHLPPTRENIAPLFVYKFPQREKQYLAISKISQIGKEKKINSESALGMFPRSISCGPCSSMDLFSLCLATLSRFLG